ncbi:hypothetical protein DNTS_004720 [Danionella cerebrum]|uniref:Rho-GAP domain-containing protein n=1 Tax=Danionella cerebrum TaxID=2873325 RepID=A0A553MUA4_9TELE|nr:hypothetical protein DNTS_004720 [Danionella translucida]
MLSLLWLSVLFLLRAGPALGYFHEERWSPESPVLAPRVMIALICRNAQHSLPHFLGALERLNYPKDRIALWVATDHNIDNTTYLLRDWLINVQKLYHYVEWRPKEEPREYHDEEGPKDWTTERYAYVMKLRQAALESAREMWADYLMVTETELQYRQCVNDANNHQKELERVKRKIIVHIRKLICQGDTVLKERQQTKPVPQGFETLELTCRPCEPGEPYLNFILSKRLPDQPIQNFSFQEFVPQSKRTPPSGRRKQSNPPSYQLDSPADDLKLDGRRTGNSDRDSTGGSLESLSSPAHGNRKLPKVWSTGTMSSDDLDEKDSLQEAESEEALSDSNGMSGKPRNASRAALTHRLKKMKSKMVKCKQCDNYILVNGIECEECGLGVHRKCLEVCQLECEHRRGFVFGTDFSSLPRECQDSVHFVVLRCTEEIENRALDIQGVYRISGSKPRILKLCQAFEIQKDQVDLSDLSPHDITSVLKHFFKERLSERDHAAETAGIVQSIVARLKELIGRLPLCNYNTVQHMMAHLNRVAEHFEENKMSPGNLGIVFGPTLLRPLVSGDVSMIALLETSYQALLVEFMVSNYDQVFGPRAASNSSPLPPPPSVPLPDTPPRANCPLSGSQDLGGAGRERPRSLENRTIKRESSEGYISDKSSSNEAMDQMSPEANQRAVLAVKSPVSPEGHLESDLQTQSRSHFSRQPVKYLRQSSLGMQSPRNTFFLPQDDTGRETLALRSADSSRSSSPEHQNLENTQGHPITKNESPGPEETAALLRERNKNQSNNTLGGRERLIRSLRRRPAEQRTAQKEVSGLRLKGDQLQFV